MPLRNQGTLWKMGMGVLCLSISELTAGSSRLLDNHQRAPPQTQARAPAQGWNSIPKSRQTPRRHRQTIWPIPAEIPDRWHREYQDEAQVLHRAPPRALESHPAHTKTVQTPGTESGAALSIIALHPAVFLIECFHPAASPLVYTTPRRCTASLESDGGSLTARAGLGAGRVAPLPPIVVRPDTAEQ